MSLNNELKYNVVDLFAGAGGLSYGFLQTGRYDIKAAFENNPNAQKTYKRNHENVEVYSDISEALTDEVKNKLGKVDVVIGGPPCQGFSNANRQKNHAINKNNTLIKKYVKVILDYKPTAFLMENVSMLKSDVHLFYVSENDKKDIEKYKIKVSDSEILLLDKDLVFDGVEAVVKDVAQISRYLWSDDDYLTLNVIYKYRDKRESDKEEIKSKRKEKRQRAIEKHKKRLLNFATRLSDLENSENVFRIADKKVASALIKYFRSEVDSKDLCNEIEPAILYQRMLSKAKELHENRIKVNEYKTNNGLVACVKSMTVLDYIEAILGSPKNGYKIVNGVLNAADFGVPQKRQRFVLMGLKSSKNMEIKLPIGAVEEKNYATVSDAIKDIEKVSVAFDVEKGNGGIKLPKVPKDISLLGKSLRNSEILYNHISTKTTNKALKRFKAIQQGQNFHNLADGLKDTYSDPTRTQNTIYLRLDYNKPSGTVVNVRKSMWIHPVKNRALSIREAARLQTFPDTFVFCGTKDSQYQQVGNAVPPMLAKAIAEQLYGYLERLNELNSTFSLRNTGRLAHAET
ncbi:MAG: DNA cytosine methyltransferase [Clostridiaceae bacterium]|nr:DNA cytosine methyltransferase [Clostridiaceae bacterium]